MQDMVEREMLLTQVCEHPEDDDARLRYADCIERSGKRSDALRAEFIRIQCELAKMKFEDERWIAFSERKDELETHCEAWGAELPDLDGIAWSDDFGRGFAWDIRCATGESFQKHAAAIFAAAPID